MTPNADPTRTQFEAYSAAFDYFNSRLFDGRLPRCLLNFSRRSRRNHGSFAPFRWEREDGRTHEISLNPDVLRRAVVDTMSTLVHEMVHLWQQEFGEVGRASYHNREWGLKMEAIGLMPSNTGEPGGRRTGQQMTHYIVEGRPFDLAFRAMPPAYLLPWVSGGMPAEKPGVKSRNKVKYTCGCGENVWGKPELAITCDLCSSPFVAEAQPAAAV